MHCLRDGRSCIFIQWGIPCLRCFILNIRNCCYTIPEVWNVEWQVRRREIAQATEDRSTFLSALFGRFLTHPLVSALLLIADLDMTARLIPRYFQQLAGFDVHHFSREGQDALLSPLVDIRLAHQLYQDCRLQHGNRRITRRVLKRRDDLAFFQRRELPGSMRMV